MKIAILGGGITGLTAAYEAVVKGHIVTLYEKSPVLGGLATGFKEKGWEWPLERAYHHLFANDTDILNFAREIGFNKIYFTSPRTDSLFETKDGKLETFSLDTPQDLLRLPLLPFLDKLRAGMVFAYLKASPFLAIFENMTCEEFCRRTMGDRVWNVLWEELFRKKFGKYAGNIVAAFIWARIKKRTKKLGYIEGGFQTFIDYLEAQCAERGVKIKKGHTIKKLTKKGSKYVIDGKEYDAVISTLPTHIMADLTQNIFSKHYLSRFEKLKYLWAHVIILKTAKPILKKTYWLSVCAKKVPFMVLVQHTNFVDKKHYGGQNLSYIGNYVDGDSALLKMSDIQAKTYSLNGLKKMGVTIDKKTTKIYQFKAPYAQPLFDNNFVQNKPDFITPSKNFFIANLDMTYPYDRGTNYAVKLGREVANVLPLDKSITL